MTIFCSIEEIIYMTPHENPKPVFAPGFRILTHDKWVLMIASSLTIIIYQYSELMSLVIAMAALHFFLFCNVFRISRLPELLWSAVFVGSAYLLNRGTFSVSTMILVSEVTAAALILWSCRQPDYHGIYWRRWNPDLQKWWESKQIA